MVKHSKLGIITEAWWTHIYVYFMNKKVIYLNHDTNGLDIEFMIIILWILLALFVFRMFVMIMKTNDVI